MRILGLTASEQLGDAQIKATWRSNDGTQECSDMLTLTVISVALTFRSDGYWTGHDPNPANNDPADGVNDAAAFSAHLGHPRLGRVSPGSPLGTTGFHKNVEIVARIQPDVTGLQCSFDFKRLRTGSVGWVKADNGFVPSAIHCPVGWCDDDLAAEDEDLNLDAPPALTLFSVDSPGAENVTVNAPCQPGVTWDGWRFVNCLSFREWIEVDGARAAGTIEWHASTEASCTAPEGWALTQVVVPDAVGLGLHQCPILGAAPLHETGVDTETLDVQAALGENGVLSADLDMRLDSYHRLHDAILAGGLTFRQQSVLLDRLLVIARRTDDASVLGIQSPVAISWLLLADLRAAEAAPLLVDRILDRRVAGFFRTTTEPGLSPAALMLIRIGVPAVAPILERCGSESDERWRLMAGVLRQIDNDSPLVRQAMRTMLDAQAWFEETEAAGAAPQPSEAERARRMRVRERLLDFLSTPEPDRPTPVISALPRPLERVTADAW